MIKIKNNKEIEDIKQGGKILSDVVRELVSYAKPGVTEIELDKLAERLIIEKGGKPGFKMVEGYNYTLCVSTNDQVVHGIPTNYILKNGDLVGLDCGVFYKGFFTDMSDTILIGKKDKEIDKFLNIGKKALDMAIKQAKVGNRIWHISKTIQEIVEGSGYSVVKSLVGHGVGRDLHEDPEIPGYILDDMKNTPLLKPGMVLAIEVIYNMGKADVTREMDDNWTIKTKDKSLSATFEKTIAVGKQGGVVITK